MKLEFEKIDHPRYKYRLVSDFERGLKFRFRDGFWEPEFEGYVDWVSDIPVAIGDFASIRIYEAITDDCETTTITAESGYAWDGASGIAIDRPANMVASLIHDILYQAMRERIISTGFRRQADFIYMLLEKEAGDLPILPVIDYYGLRVFGGVFARPKD